MKRSIIFILLFFYFVLSLGITGKIHFCEGKLHSIDFFVKKESCCKIKKGCCKNVKVTFQKNKIEKDNSQANFVLKSLTVIPEEICFHFHENKIDHPQAQIVKIYPPPETYNYPSLHICNCVFII